MLAVVKIAGQQFKVKAGDSLYVPHIEGKAGDSDTTVSDATGFSAFGAGARALRALRLTGSSVGITVFSL
jgi:large subunit ribosomal protein L21